jgi:hypothetical protein
MRLIVSSAFFLLCAHAWALDGSLSLQAGAASAFQSNGKALPASFGPTGYLSLDFNLSPSFALGLGTGLTGLLGSGHIWVDGTHLLGRWSPWPGSDWSPYLSAGFGFRPLSQMFPQHSWWDGTYQGTAAIGVRHPIARGMDLDLTAFYDINSPQADPLNSVGVRVGLAFPFGGEAAAETAQKPATTSTPEPQVVAESVTAPTAQMKGKKGKKSKLAAQDIDGAPTDGSDSVNSFSAHDRRVAARQDTEAAQSQTTPTMGGVGERAETEGAETSPLDHTYIVKRGDCLWMISKHEYGIGHAWKRIYQANEPLLPNPDFIKPRLQLQIPDGKGTTQTTEK